MTSLTVLIRGNNLFEFGVTFGAQNFYQSPFVSADSTECLMQLLAQVLGRWTHQCNDEVFEFSTQFTFQIIDQITPILAQKIFSNFMSLPIRTCGQYFNDGFLVGAETFHCRTQFVTIFGRIEIWRWNNRWRYLQFYRCWKNCRKIISINLFIECSYHFFQAIILNWKIESNTKRMTKESRLQNFVYLCTDEDYDVS